MADEKKRYRVKYTTHVGGQVLAIGTQLTGDEISAEHMKEAIAAGVIEDLAAELPDRLPTRAEYMAQLRAEFEQEAPRAYDRMVARYNEAHGIVMRKPPRERSAAADNTPPAPPADADKSPPEGKPEATPPAGPADPGTPGGTGVQRGSRRTG